MAYIIFMPPDPNPHHRTDSLSTQSKSKSKWLKVSRSVGLYRYIPNGIYHARVRHGGELHRESLETKDLAFAKRKLAKFKERLERTEPRYGKITFVEWLERHYFPTLTNSPGALAAKQRIIARVKKHWFKARSQPMRDVKESEVLTFLNAQYGGWSESYWNSALALIRGALGMAVQDRVPHGEFRGRYQMAQAQATDQADTHLRAVPSHHCRCAGAALQP
jgi:hypothetical protein